MLCRTGNAHACQNTKVIGVDRDGCFADFIAMPATNIWPLDDDISYDIGGIHDPMGNAFHTALTAEIPGATVLITGCGPIGIFAVGICVAAGASRVIASDVNDTRLALAKQMGAHDVVHPAGGGGGRAGARPAGSAWTWCSRCPACRRRSTRRSQLVRPAGRVQMLGVPAKPMEFDFATELVFKGVTVYGVTGRRMYDTWHQMSRFLRSGKFDPTPVITHRFPLERFDDAIAAIKSGAAGKVIFDIA